MALRIAKHSIVATGLLATSLALLTPSPVPAHVVEVTTSLSLEQVEDKTQLREALKAEVDRVLATAIAFTPTVIALTDARRVGERLMVRLLIADADGERLIEDLERDGSAETSRQPMRL
jgi:hypothetical protein